MPPLVALLAALATFRITLLITADAITERPRTAIMRRGGWPAYWVTCAWCASAPVALAVVGSALAWSDGWGWQLAAGSLSASAVTGILAEVASP
jgi:hypothetical protein